MGLFSHKKTNTEVATPQVGGSLRRDKLLLLTTATDVIKSHWCVLEDKLEQSLVEDDYGNKFMDSRFSNEIVYFSEKVVYPTLKELVDKGRVSNKALFFLFHNSLGEKRIGESWFGIRYDKPSETNASRLLSAIDVSMSDSLMYRLYGGEITTETYHDTGELNSSKLELGQLIFGGDFKASSPIKVTPLASIVFTLFFAMYNNKKDSRKPEVRSIEAVFTGNDPYKYEEFIRKLLQSRGFTAKRTRSSGDYGVDVLASKDGKSFALQCKLFNRPVGTKAVQEIVSGRIFYKTDYAVVVSDNSFTPAAKTLARKSDVILVHHKKLLHAIESLAGDREVEK